MKIKENGSDFHDITHSISIVNQHDMYRARYNIALCFDVKSKLHTQIINSIIIRSTVHNVTDTNSLLD